jgi:hypothetical protein
MYLVYSYTHLALHATSSLIISSLCTLHTAAQPQRTVSAMFTLSMFVCTMYVGGGGVGPAHVLANHLLRRTLDFPCLFHSSRLVRYGRLNSAGPIGAQRRGLHYSMCLTPHHCSPPGSFVNRVSHRATNHTSPTSAAALQGNGKVQRRAVITTTISLLLHH